MKLLKLIKNECGGAFIWALILLMVGSLTLPPLMSLASNAIEASQMYERKTFQAYAADAGIEDGLWEIKYGDLDALFTSSTYDPYNYADEWSYNLSEQEHGNTVNGYDPEISLRNVWIPIPDTPPNAQAIIENGKLIVTGCTSGDSTYQIKIIYNPEEDDDDLIVESLGIWLPNGFEYAGSNNLEEGCLEDGPPVYCDHRTPDVTDHAGGQAVVWSFSPGTPVAITDLPGVDPLASPIEAEITFEFNSDQEAVNPAAIAWIETSGVVGIEYSWDADTKVYEITSIAGDATVKAHAAKSEARELGATIGGDYFIIGNSLLDYTRDENYRNRLHRETSATVAEDDIPSSATIDRAYLYWTGWMDWHDYDDISGGGSSWDTRIFRDECDNFSQHDSDPPDMDGNWDDGDDWSTTGEFEGHHEDCASWTTIFEDTCNNIDANWIYNNNWDDGGGRFVGEDHAGDGSGGGVATVTLLDDDFESGLGNWNTDWFENNSYYNSSDTSIQCGRWNNDLTSINLDASDATSISITFRYLVDDIDRRDDVYVQYFNGSRYVNIEEIGDDAEDQDPWLTYTDTITDPQYFNSNFRIRIVGGSIDSGENLWIDDVVITKEAPITGSIVPLLDDDFESGLGNWNTDWFENNSYYNSSDTSIQCGRRNNDLTSINLDASDATSISITFRYLVDDIDGNDNVYVRYYDGSSYDYIEEIGDDAEDQDPWLTYSDTVTDSQYFNSNFRIMISGGSIDWGENLWIDDVVITKEVPIPGSNDYLTMASGQPLGSIPGDIIVSWEQDYAGNLESGDCLDVYFYDEYGNWDNVTDYVNNVGFCGDGDWSTRPEIAEYVIGDHGGFDDQFRHSNFKVQFRLHEGNYWESSTEYCLIDNITIKTCADPADDSDRYLTLDTNVELAGYSDVTLYWNQSETGTLEDASNPGRDTLWFSLWDGSDWSDNIEAFTDDNPDSTFTYSIPSAYLTNNFRMRFYIEGFDDTNESCYIDNITIGDMTEGCESLKYPTSPTTANLTHLIEDCARVNTVMFSGTQVMADEWRIAESTDLPGQTTYEDRWSYACRYDATDLINQWIEDGDDIASNGAGEYTLGHVMTPNEGKPGYSADLWPTGETGYPLASPAEDRYPPTRHNYCHGGWSLVLIYSSAETDGHQLYLFDDTLAEIWHYNPDIRGVGEAGISVDGFLVPAVATGDEVARVTIFAGEGDRGITGDRFFFNKGGALSSDTSLSNNIWDSQLSGGLVPGIDIDTFTITYPTLEEGDTEAHIDYLGTNPDPDHYYRASDGFTPIYVILSFRSEITTGGTLDYLLEF